MANELVHFDVLGSIPLRLQLHPDVIAFLRFELLAFVFFFFFFFSSYPAALGVVERRPRLFGVLVLVLHHGQGHVDRALFPIPSSIWLMDTHLSLSLGGWHITTLLRPSALSRDRRISVEFVNRCRATFGHVVSRT